MKERIINYLAAGLKPANISTIVGCSPAYISQLLSDPDFKAQVEAKMLDGSIEADTTLDVKYESLEHTLIKSMQERVGEAEFSHLSKALDSVTKAQDMRAKRKNPALREAASLVQIVQINIPQHAIAAPVMALNSDSEVVAIDNRPLAPMSSEGIKNLFAQRALAKTTKDEAANEQHAIPSNKAFNGAIAADF